MYVTAWSPQPMLYPWSYHPTRVWICHVNLHSEHSVFGLTDSLVKCSLLVAFMLALWSIRKCGFLYNVDSTWRARRDASCHWTWARQRELQLNSFKFDDAPWKARWPWICQRVWSYKWTLDDTSWMARLRPIPHEDKLAFKEVLDRYLLQGFKVIETLPETSRVSAAMLVRHQIVESLPCGYKDSGPIFCSHWLQIMCFWKVTTQGYGWFKILLCEVGYDCARVRFHC